MTSTHYIRAGFACLAALLLATGCESLRGGTASPDQADAAGRPAPAPTPVSKPAAAGARIVLRFTVEKIEGDLLISILNSEEGWKNSQSVKTFTVPVEAETVTVETDSLAPGVYAVKAFHDINGNGKLDTNFLGIPNEPYAFSNNAPGPFGPPSFEAAAFEAGEGVTVHEIEIR